MDLDYDFDRAERREKFKRNSLKLIGWILALGFAIGLAWAIVYFAFEETNMVGESMNPTLQSSDMILINKLSYRLKEPERFDIIVFKKDGKEHSYYSIKRIVGLPGETVIIRDGKVYIDGSELIETVIVDSMNLAGLAAEEVILDEDEYFVLGDNRNESEDSRFANVGNVVRDEIIGTAWIRVNKFAIISKLNMRDKDDIKESEE